MDYPHSVPDVGLLDGKFTDGDPLTGLLPSLDPSSWANGVTDELLNVIEAAGLTPTEGLSNQFLQALRRTGVFATQAQFDNSTAAATTAFVQRALGNYANVFSYVPAQTLTGAHVGTFIQFTPTTNINVTLPDPATVPEGGCITLYNSSNSGAYALTVIASGGTAIGGHGGVVPAGAIYLFVRRKAGDWAGINPNAGGLAAVGTQILDMRGSRTSGVTYTNTYGRPIVVSLSLETTNVNQSCVLVVNGFNLGGSSFPGSGFSVAGQFIVPPGATYRLPAGPYNIIGWLETR
ncbi:hypothetical protein [Chitiniphilus eburneus]|uniref:Tail fiber protein n=1 Tax=Chitiniphilus eburneus TaxID=2571148 RepID=A0A4U0QBQ0_9NEIS|nr:hypothetical protein [Chitiniphilus eburneus]TJZ78799.1 hypothetical protein FAZ21_00470 [Chitiniphilus eburneus]